MSEKTSKIGMQPPHPGDFIRYEQGHIPLAQLRSRNACLDICSLVVK